MDGFVWILGDYFGRLVSLHETLLCPAFLAVCHEARDRAKRTMSSDGSSGQNVYHLELVNL